MVGNGLVVTMDCATGNLPKITLLHCSLVIFTNQPQLGADDWAVIFSWGLMVQLMTLKDVLYSVQQPFFSRIGSRETKQKSVRWDIETIKNPLVSCGFLWIFHDFSMDVSQSMDFTPGGGGWDSAPRERHVLREDRNQLQLLQRGGRVSQWSRTWCPV